LCQILDNVKRREPLAEVTGRDWIGASKEIYSDAIELKPIRV